MAATLAGQIKKVLSIKKFSNAHRDDISFPQESPPDDFSGTIGVNGFDHQVATFQKRL